MTKLQVMDKARNSPCECCGRVPTSQEKNHAAHIRTKAVRGGEAWENILSLCWRCHVLQHSRGFKRMTESSPRLMQALDKRGWHFVKYFDVWKIERK